MRHTLSVLVENNTGVLSRVSGLFSRRGFNIESLSVSTTDKKEISRMTIVVEGDEDVMEQVTKQLHKLVEVIKISNITGEEFIDRGMALFKVASDPSKKRGNYSNCGYFQSSYFRFQHQFHDYRGYRQ